MLKEDKLLNFENFFEYRKGSKEFGGIVASVMDWLRLHKNQSDPVDHIETNLDSFLKETNIDLQKLKKFIESKTKLINFKIEINGDKILFLNLNDSKKQGLPWRENNEF